MSRGLSLGVLPLWLGLCLLCACGSEGTSEVNDFSSTNVLVIVSDDQGLQLGAYGVPGLPTPNLDRLAAEGLLFERAYTPTAVCTPSRAALYTGRVPARNGCLGFEPIRDDVPLWSELLGEAGYRTGLVGKLGGKPVERFQFDFLARTRPKDEGARDVQYYAEEVERFLGQDDERPFCLLVNLRDAHFPFPSDGAPTGLPGVSSEPHRPEDVTVPGFLPDLPEVRQDLARFYDALRRLDATVGEILAQLEESGQSERTLVLFTSDHGTPFPFAKTTVRQAGIRVPLLARWPGVVQPGRRTPALVSFVDVLPTLLDLRDQPTVDGFDGRSLVSILQGETDQHRERVFATHTRHRVPPELPARAVVQGDWKYVRNFGEGRFDNNVLRTSQAWPAMLRAGEADPALAERITRLLLHPREELYDLASDPHELVNLAAAPEQQARLADLKQLVRLEMERCDDPLLNDW